jgi:hypothetical protein
MASAEGYLLSTTFLSVSLYRLSENFIGEKGEALIRKALQGKAGYALLF